MCHEGDLLAPRGRGRREVVAFASLPSPHQLQRARSSALMWFSFVGNLECGHCREGPRPGLQLPEVPSPRDSGLQRGV